MLPAAKPNLFRGQTMRREANSCMTHRRPESSSRSDDFYHAMIRRAQVLHKAGIANLVTPPVQLYHDGLGKGRYAFDIWAMLPMALTMRSPMSLQEPPKVVIDGERLVGRRRSEQF